MQSSDVANLVGSIVNLFFAGALSVIGWLIKTQLEHINDTLKVLRGDVNNMMITVERHQVELTGVEGRIELLESDLNLIKDKMLSVKVDLEVIKTAEAMAKKKRGDSYE